MRSWATVQPLVAAEVEKVDQARIAVAEELLNRAGVAIARAAPRARLLYWAAIGRLMLPFPERNLLTRDEISALADLMLHD